VKRQALVLDANILIRGTLGTKVRNFIADYCDAADFLVPGACVEDARTHLPEIAAARGLDRQVVAETLEALLRLVEIVPVEVYAAMEVEAKSRLASRDLDDWEVLALALSAECPVWTEDQDFFGVGVATWRTATVERYLRAGEI
jgi:predicted nucleic acid-binding protein